MNELEELLKGEKGQLGESVSQLIVSATYFLL